MLKKKKNKKSSPYIYLKIRKIIFIRLTVGTCINHLKYVKVYDCTTVHEIFWRETYSTQRTPNKPKHLTEN